MVEAAGVEPASEKVCREKTTCVSGSLFFVHPMRNQQDWGSLAWLISVFSSRRKPYTYPAKWRSWTACRPIGPERAT